mmetsp:Transcript_22414/g.48244  ORF Transcript_22414/g.48244 Transcript_22414/m.48244 type:complete len:82 (+) Transcript_22414:32-277(+)
MYPLSDQNGMIISMNQIWAIQVLPRNADKMELVEIELFIAQTYSTNPTIVTIRPKAPCLVPMCRIQVQHPISRNPVKVTPR